jgi:uncharacterized protein (TIGR03545 family)
MTAPDRSVRARIFRWKGVVPLALLFLLVGVLYWLYADRLVERSVEHSGTALVGARVDVDEADIRLTDGVVMLRGLAVTNPEKPLTNLFEADEIALNLRVAPLLEKKVIIDTVAVRGMRFGTARQESGALDRPSEASSEARSAIRTWQARLPVPSLSLEGLGQVVNVEGITPDSLATLRTARALVTSADSARGAWLGRVQQLDPRPAIDSAAALAQRLQGQNLRTLGLAGARDAVGSARRTIQELSALDDRLAGLQRGVDSTVLRARSGLAQLGEARRADYNYARGLVKLPVFDAPSLGPALFGRFAAEQAAPLLYWLRMAERYMPPGLEARLHQGPDRARRAGSTVVFPKWEDLPRFLLGLAELSLEIGGTGVAAGDYAARVTDVTTEPALVGRPLTFQAGRTRGQVGPKTVRVGGSLDHSGPVIRDSAAGLVSGLTLPTVTLGPLGVELGLGQGGVDLVLARSGDSLDARLAWASNAVTWNRIGANASATDTAGGPLPGGLVTGQGVARALARSVENIVWRTVSGLRDVRIEARLDGSLAQPRLSVGSNVARALADGLRAQLGAELREAEAQVRARVDALVSEHMAEAETAVTTFETDVRDRVAAERVRLEQVKRDLEARVRALAGGIPGIGG